MNVTQEPSFFEKFFFDEYGHQQRKENTDKGDYGLKYDV